MCTRPTTRGVSWLAWIALACGPGVPAEPPPPPPVDPLGSFVFSASYQGTPVTGTIDIQEGDDGLEGWITPDPSLSPPFPITSVTVEGQELHIVADGGGDLLILNLVFAHETFTGSWSMGAEGGSLTGARR